jgi:DNA-3-methyladenine glycosylase
LGARISARGVSIELTEVEAYEGRDDPASHAFRGPTPRTAVMFGPPGHLYVYFVYGMHWCANVVCGPDGTAAAVLLRAGRVVAGHRLVRERRGPAAAWPARGPANLAACLGLGRTDSGVDLLRRGAVVRLRLPPTPPDRWSVGPRVGVAAAADRPLRFWRPDEPSVSAYRRGGRMPAAGTGQTERL